MSQIINSNYFLMKDIENFKKSNDEVLRGLSDVKLSESAINKTLEDLKNSGSSVDFAPVYQKINEVEQGFSLKFDNTEKETGALIKKETGALNNDLEILKGNIKTNLDNINKLNQSTSTKFRTKIYYTDVARGYLACEGKKNQLDLESLNNDIDTLLGFKDFVMLILGNQFISQYRCGPDYFNHKFIVNRELDFKCNLPTVRGSFSTKGNYKFSPYYPKNKFFDICFDAKQKRFYINLNNINYLITFPEFIVVLKK